MLNNIMVSGASMFKSTEKDGMFMRGFSMISNGALYHLNPESAIDQFRYWVTTNLHNHEIMLKVFNFINENKLAKEGNKIIIDSIGVNMKIVVPMLTS